MSAELPESSRDERDLQRALRLIRLLRDPALPGLLLMAALVVAGFAAITIGYFGAARLIYVPLQMPEIVSGGVGGLALIGVGAYLFGVQIDRQHAAREEMLTDEMLGEMADLVALSSRLRDIAARRRTADR